MRFRSECPDFPEIKAALGAAFKALRQRDFIARQSFLCCRSCAGADLDTPENQGTRAVYYTRQDRDQLAETGQVYLAFGIIGAPLDDAYIPVGQEIADTLTAHSLEVEWDGNPMTRILVKGLIPPPPESTYLDLVGVAA